MRTALALSAALLGSTSAFALDPSVPSQYDPHMRTFDYNPANQALLVIPVGRSATIEVRPGECVKLNAFGEKNGPAGGITTEEMKEPMYNIDPIFGLREGETNLNLITADCDDHSHEHNYSLFVKVIPRLTDGKDNPDITTHLKYTYTALTKQTAQQVAVEDWKQKRQRAEHEKVLARLAVEPFYQGPKGRNYRYIVIGDSSIAPVVNGGSSDNHNLAAFRWPGNMEIPAILAADGGPTPGMCDLKEQPSKALLRSPEHTIQSRPQDDWQIVPVLEHYRLRLGNGQSGKVTDIFSCGYDPIGDNPGTGSGSGDVIRMVRSGND